MVKVRNKHRFVKYKCIWYGTGWPAFNFEYSKLKIMETHAITLPASHYRALEKIVTALIEKWDTQYIICFGSVEEYRTTTSCFGNSNDKNAVRYYLLMITTENHRMEHQVQDFINTHHPEVNVTIAVHGLESVTHAVNQGSRFYATACQYGMQLYSKSGLRLDLNYHSINPVTKVAKAEKNYHHYYEMALGFWQGAENSFETGYYAVCVFMLHQAVEHACKALIRVFTAYQCDMHNISRLLDHCALFSDKLAYALPRRTDEDKRLFALLRDGYSETRYNVNYTVKAADADALLTGVKELLNVTEELGLAKIVQYQQEADQAAPVIHVTSDINNPLPYAG
jgi:HEPN domain-containing protein